MSKESSIIIPSWVQPIFLGLVVIFIYVTTLTYWHSGDDIQWTMTVESSVTGEPVLHPASANTIITPPTTPQQQITQVRYFLELPTFARIYRASRIMRWSDNAVRPIQLTHAIFGAIGVIFFFLALALFVPRTWSFIISLGLAFSYAWWYYSTHLDYTIISHSLSCIFLYLLASLCYSQSSGKFQWQVLALGFVNALTILYLVTGLLLIPVILVVLHLHYDKKKDRSNSIFLYLSSMLLAIVFFGSIIWITDVGWPHSWTNIWRNLTYSGAFAHEFALSDAPKSLYGFAKALVTYPTLGHQAPRELFASSSLLDRASFLAWYAVEMVIAVSPFIILTKLFRQLDRHKNFAIGLGVWFFIQGPFAIYWEPSYIKWWTGALVPWWGLIGILLVVTKARLSFLDKTLSIALCTVVVILFGVNFFSDFLPNSRPDSNRWLQITNMLGNSTGPNDLFVSSGNLPLDFYLPYFARRHTLSYGMINISKGRAAANKDISEAILVTLERGNRVFVYSSSDQDIGELSKIIISPSLRYERVIFKGILSPGFVVYEVTGFKP